MKPLPRTEARPAARARARRLRFFAAACVVLAVFAALAAFELALRYGGISDYDRKRPSWDPPERFRKLNQRINEANEAFSRRNRFGFNDRERSEVKPRGIRYRIAVLGDSFIWGDGVPYDVIWSHKLERMVAKKAPDVEVLSWGRCGWSTLDELRFLQKDGIRFRPDLLIVGFVTNDPDVGVYKQKEFPVAAFFSPLHLFFPDTANALSARAQKFLYRRVLPGYGYSAWQDLLYTPENLARYDGVLASFAAFCKKEGLAVIFVLTPNNYAPGNEDTFDKVKPLFARHGLRVLDTYPAVYRRLNGRPFEELNANPANGHPGDPVTSVYADEVFAFLTKDPSCAFLFAPRGGNPPPPKKEKE